MIHLLFMAAVATNAFTSAGTNTVTICYSEKAEILLISDNGDFKCRSYEVLSTNLILHSKTPPTLTYSNNQWWIYFKKHEIGSSEILFLPFHGGEQRL